MFRWIKNIYNLSAKLDYYEKEIGNLRAGIEHVNDKVNVNYNELGDIIETIVDLNNLKRK